MVRHHKLHPVLWLNAILASPLFIIAINIGFTVMVYMRLDEGKIDVTMSWFTMVMDQIIISGGWIIYRQQQKAWKEHRSQMNRMEKKLDHDAQHKI